MYLPHFLDVYKMLSDSVNIYANHLDSVKYLKSTTNMFTYFAERKRKC